MEKPAVLVTGGAGYVGSHVALALADAGRPVVILDNLSASARTAADPRATFIEGEVADGALVRRILADHRIDTVIHCAGSVNAAHSVAHPLAHYANNTEATRALAESLVAGGVRRLVFSSSAAVYGAQDTILVDETVAPAPISPYGRSKWMAEQILTDAAAAHPLQVCLLRYFNAVGADPAGRSGPRGAGGGHLLMVAVEAATGGRAFVPVYGDDYPTRDGTGMRDYVHVSDLAQAHLVVLEAMARPGPAVRLLNCGYGTGHTVLEVLAAVERAGGAPVPRRILPRRAGDPAAVIADASALRALGWRPAHATLEAMVGDALAWERRARGAALKTVQA